MLGFRMQRRSQETVYWVRSGRFGSINPKVRDQMANSFANARATYCTFRMTLRWKNVSRLTGGPSNKLVPNTDIGTILDSRCVAYSLRRCRFASIETIHALHFAQQLLSPTSPCISLFTKIVLVALMCPLIVLSRSTASFKAVPSRCVWIGVDCEGPVEIMDIFRIVGLLGRGLVWFVAFAYCFFLSVIWVSSAILIMLAIA